MNHEAFLAELLATQIDRSAYEDKVLRLCREYGKLKFLGFRDEDRGNGQIVRSSLCLRDAAMTAQGVMIMLEDAIRCMLNSEISRQ